MSRNCSLNRSGTRRHAALPRLPGRASAEAPASLDELLTPHLARHGLPALAAAVVKEGKIVAAGAVGTRRVGESPVTLDDRFHLGSDTKAMTALLAAMFVEEGKLRWDSTVRRGLPGAGGEDDPGLRKVTLTQFLSHTSGVPADNEAFRDLFAKAIPGTATSTSSAPGWCGGGAAAARRAGDEVRLCEHELCHRGRDDRAGRRQDLGGAITERVFAPLDLRTAGLGPQATLGRVDAPLGHDVVDGKTKAFLAGPNGDNPPCSAPPGSRTCRCSTSPAGPGGTPARASAGRSWSGRRR